MENLRGIFLNKAKKFHDDKWNYSKVVYVNGNTPIIIICPIHGDFQQKPKYHLHSKYPCPKCVHPSCIPNPNKQHPKKRTKQFPDEIIKTGKGIFGFLQHNRTSKTNRKIHG